MTRGSVAAKVRADKEEHPERYCSEPRCLWRIQKRDSRTARGWISDPCPKHTPTPKCDDPGAHRPGCQCDGGEPLL